MPSSVWSSDGALQICAAEFGFQRQDADAVRLHRAVATAFADIRVDEHALRRIVHQLALTAATLFGGPSLFVDDAGHALGFLQFALHAIAIVAVMDAGIRRQCLARVMPRLNGDKKIGSASCREKGGKKV